MLTGAALRSIQTQRMSPPRVGSIDDFVAAGWTRRRYLDAAWIRRDGRRVVAEVDEALHLAPRRWWDDQLRQNEIVLQDDLLLRFPSVVLRHEQPTVVAQLSRALRGSAT